jgi:hypothetical protein
MAELLSSALLAANPSLNANPRRYSSLDSDNLNRVIGQLRLFLGWKGIDRGSVYIVLGHDQTSSGVNAQFYDHESTSAPPPILETTYQFAPLLAAPTQQYSLKELTALFDIRMFTQQLLQRNINLTRFMKRATAFAICNLLESALINGDESSNPAEFNGLRALVARSMGRQIAASPADGLEALDEAMLDIRSRAGRCDLIVMNTRAVRQLLLLQRQQGYRPRFRRSRRLGGVKVPLYNGVPVCRTDHIATGTDGTTSVFFLTRGKNGVYGILSRRLGRKTSKGKRRARPQGIHFTRVYGNTEPVHSYQAHLYSGLVCETNDGLIELTNWSVARS